MSCIYMLCPLYNVRTLQGRILLDAKARRPFKGTESLIYGHYGIVI